MANVIREDVVSVEFDIDDGGIRDSLKMLENFKEEIFKGFQGLPKPVDDLKKSLTSGIDTSGITDMKSSSEQAKETIKELESGVKSVKGEFSTGIDTSGIDGVKKSAEQATESVKKFSSITESIERFDERIKSLKGNFKSLGNALAHPLSTVKNGFSNIKNEISETASKIKNLAQTKMSNLSSNIKEVYSALSRGQTGARGFVTALKSIGKVGFEKTISGFQSIKKSIKSITFDKIKSGLSSIKSGASSVLSGFKSLGSGAQKVASNIKTAFSNVGSKIKSVASNISSAADSITSKLFNIKSLVAGVATGAVVQQSVGIVVDRQNITSQFEVLLGSAEKANERVSELTDFAGMTPFTRDEIFAASKQLQVFTGDALSTGDSLRIIGDVAAGTGQQFEDVALWTGRLYDAMKSGRTVGEMTSRLQEMGAISGEDRTKIEKLAESGEDITQTWTEVEKIFSRYDGTMEKLSNNLGNMLTSLKSFATNSIFLPLGEGIASGLQPAIQKFRDFRKSNKEDVTAMGEVINNFAEKICVPLFNKIEQGVEKLIIVIGSLKNGADGLNKLAGNSPFFTGLMEIIDYISLHKEVVKSAFQGIAIAIGGIVGAGKLIKIGKALSFLISPLGIVASCAAIMFMIFKNGSGTVDSFVDGLSGKLSDFIPFVINGIKSVTEKITNFLPQAMSTLTEIVSSVIGGIIQILPDLITCVSQIFSSFAQGFSQVFPQLIDIGIEIISTIVDSINANIGIILNAAIEIINALAIGLVDAIPKLLQAGLELLLGIVHGILAALPNLIEMIPAIVDALVNGLMQMLPMLIIAGVQIIQMLMQGIVQNLPVIVQAAIKIINSLINGLVMYLPMIIQAGIQFIVAFVQGLMQSVPLILQAILQLINGIFNAIIQNFPTIFDLGIQMIMYLINGIVSMLPQIIQSAFQLIIMFVQGIISMLPQIITIGIQLIVGLIQGIVQMLPTIIAAGIQLIICLAVGLIQSIPQLLGAIPQIFGAFIKGIFSIDWLQVGLDLIKSLISGIWNGIKNVGKSVWKGIKSLFTGGDGGDAAKELEALGTSTGKSYVDGISEGVDLETTGLDMNNQLATGISTNSYLSADAAALTATSTNEAYSNITYGVGSYGTTANNLLAVGISSSSSAPISAVSSVAQQIKCNLGSVTNTAVYGFDMNSQLAESMSSSAYLPVDAASSMAIDTNMALDGIAINASNCGANVPTSIANSINANSGTAVSAASGMASQITSAGNADVEITLKVNDGALQNSSSTIASFAENISETVILAFSNMNKVSCQHISGMQKSVVLISKLMSTTVIVNLKTMSVQAVIIVQSMSVSIVSTMSQMKSSIDGLDLYSTGVNVMNGLINGMESRRGGLISTAQSIAQTVKNTMNNALDIHSPSRELYKTGVYTGLGQINGMKSTLPEIQQTADKMGQTSIPDDNNRYAPSASPANYSRSTTSENHTYSPTFNLTISGTNDDRTMARKVKKWISEALEETFSSYESKNATVREV